MKAVIMLVAVAFIGAGCSNPNSVPSHTAGEQKAMDDYAKMTPEQKIDLVQKGSMPAEAKVAQIAKIKQQYGLQ